MNANIEVTLNVNYLCQQNQGLCFLKKRGCTCMHKYIENLKYEKNLTAYKNSRGSSRAVAVAFLCRTL